MPTAARTTIDAAEVERFSRMAAEWWSPTGKFKPLHKFNPVRLTYIREEVIKAFGCDPKSVKPFKGLADFWTLAAAAGFCASRWRGWGRQLSALILQK